MEHDEYQRALQLEHEKGEAYGKGIAEGLGNILTKFAAAHQPGVQMCGELMCGELMVTEPLRDYRKEVWIETFTAVAGCFNAKDAAVAESWADKALKLFDERFPK